MSTAAIIVTIVSSLLSGALATIVTIHINNKHETLERKRCLVDDIFGYRYQLTGNHQNRNELEKALNRIPIVFAEHERVLDAFDNLYDAVSTNSTERIAAKIDDLLVTLCKEMCKAAEIKTNDWNDSRFKNVFNIKPTDN